jgi:hypothetical protein
MFSSNSSQVSSAVNYIEEVFSCFLYTGTGAALTITNNIDLAGKGGLVWLKNRTSDLGALDHYLEDTARGTNKYLSSNTTNQQQDDSAYGGSVTSFNSSGFSLGTATSINYVGSPAATYVSWTFRKQPKFFDVVTYTGTGSNATIAHSLGVVPGCIIVKRTDTAAAWAVYHRSLANTQYLVLNSTVAAATGATWWNSTTPTSAVFSVGTDASVNASGGTYVAYIFAHDAGGFGLLGTDNVISCGSFASNVSGGISPVNLGFEPQWLLVKNTLGDGWRIQDVMRGWSQTQLQDLTPNATDAERVNNNNPSYLSPTATGFSTPTPGIFTPSNTFIYIAIRRGPMKVPTDATKVFKPVAYSGNGVDNNQTTNFPVDLGFVTSTSDVTGFFAVDRLRGPDQWPLNTWTTGAESTLTGYIGFDSNTQFKIINNGIGRLNSSVRTYVLEAFQRAPGFFDVVCYTGTGSATTFSHNLATVPELIIFKRRSNADPWMVYCNRYNGGVNANQYYQTLNSNDSESSGSGLLNNTNPTSSVFTVGTWNENNFSGSTFVAYLFATCAGVSKVGSYTGNGTTQTINCGFGAGGARFVMIKRTDSAGDFYVYDTARGMTVLTDPYLTFNGNAANTATLGSVTTVSTGFALNESILAGINTSAATYIFLAIA